MIYPTKYFTIIYIILSIREYFADYRLILVMIPENICLKLAGEVLCSLILLRLLNLRKTASSLLRA